MIYLQFVLIPSLEDYDNKAKRGLQNLQGFGKGKARRRRCGEPPI
jgi:hypothetical protein